MVLNEFSRDDEFTMPEWVENIVIKSWFVRLGKTTTIDLYKYAVLMFLKILELHCEACECRQENYTPSMLK